MVWNGMWTVSVSSFVSVSWCFFSYFCCYSFVCLFVGWLGWPLNQHYTFEALVVRQPINFRMCHIIWMLNAHRLNACVTMWWVLDVRTLCFCIHMHCVRCTVYFMLGWCVWQCDMISRTGLANAMICCV